MHYIPFDALIINQKYPKKINFTKLDYLIKSYSITSHYSATSWYNSRFDSLQKQNEYEFIGFAPVFNNNIFNDTILYEGINQKISYLPYSKSEIDSIINLFDNQNSKGFYNNEANESNFYRYCNKSKYIHIATHGYYHRNSNPSFLLWPEQLYTSDEIEKIYINEGVVRIEEIYSTQINTDLVVLSTCESGQGVFIEGEGIISLTRSFLIAGTKNIIYTMWPIDDRITNQFMFLLYQYIIQGKSVSRAIQETKLQFIGNAKYSFPRIWSSYYLSGN